MPYISLITVIRYWVAFPDTMELISITNIRHTYPYMESREVLKSEVAARRQLLDRVQSRQDTGVEYVFEECFSSWSWLAEMEAMADDWWPLWMEHQHGTKEVVFLHHLLFPDGFPVYTRKQSSFHIFAVSALEFPAPTRAVASSAALAVLSFLSREAKSEGVLDKIVTKLGDEFSSLKKGVQIGTNQENGILFISLQNDLPKPNCDTATDREATIRRRNSHYY